MGNASIVTLGVPPSAKLDVRAADEPWDAVLDRVVAGAGLASVRRGAVILIGPPAAIGGVVTVVQPIRLAPRKRR